MAHRLARRSRRRRNHSYSYNRRRSRYSRRRRNPFNRHRRRRRNPSRSGGGTASLRHPVSALTAGFKPSTLMNILPVAGGAFANHWVRGQIASRVPQVATGIASYGVGIATAGAMLFVPKYGRQLFTGALLEEVMRATSEYFPSLRSHLMGLLGMNDYFDTNTPIGMGRTGDYFDTNTPIIQGGQIEGMSDFLTANDTFNDQFDPSEAMKELF